MAASPPVFFLRVTDEPWFRQRVVCTCRSSVTPRHECIVNVLRAYPTPRLTISLVRGETTTGSLNWVKESLSEWGGHRPPPGSSPDLKSPVTISAKHWLTQVPQDHPPPRPIIRYSNIAKEKFCQIFENSPEAESNRCETDAFSSDRPSGLLPEGPLLLEREGTFPILTVTEGR